MKNEHITGLLRSGLFFVFSYASVHAGINHAFADATPKPPSCSSATGGSSDSLMASTNGLYECAYTAGLDNRKINAFETQTWTSSTAPGYRKQYNCHGQSGGVAIDPMYEGTDFGSSITYWAQNTQDGSRHWGAGVLWQTQENGGVRDDQYIHNCNGNHGDIRANKVYITTTKVVSYPGKVNIGTPATVNISVSAPYGNSPPQGKVYLYQQKNSSDTTATDPKIDWVIGQGTLDSNGNTTIITGFAGKDAEGNEVYPKSGTILIYAAMLPNPNVQKNDPAPTPPNKGWVGSQSDSYPVKLAIKYTTEEIGTNTASVPNTSAVSTDKLPEYLVNQAGTQSLPDTSGIAIQNVIGDGSPALYALCPRGMKPLNSEAWGESQSLSANGVLPVEVKGLFGSLLRLPKDQSSARVQLQVLCRNAKAGVMRMGGIQYGTPKPDHLSSSEEDGLLFGGLGNDTFRLEYSNTLGLGGPGNDNFLLRADQTAANGGPGNDRIEVEGSFETLIIGGPGKDTLIGGSGLTRINAIDGKPGDKVVCNSPENQVMADEGDIIVGPCVRVYPDNTQY